ncbi:hypothetical protein [Streptomyces olivoreticuli]|uniref:hypothetical protein n=1 Tax=Streptomyces olivoreticuli TaxID=68246 RepID=UPI0030B867D7
MTAVFCGFCRMIGPAVQVGCQRGADAVGLSFWVPDRACVHGGRSVESCGGEERDGTVLGTDEKLDFGAAQNDAFRAAGGQVRDDLLAGGV